jgi:polar amino acid transport system substrate-binding protein
MPGGKPLLRLRACLAALVVTGLLTVPDEGACGPVYDRVMKTGTVRIGVPYNRIPQGFLKPTGEWVGFEVDLASEMASHTKLKLETVKVNDKTWRTMLSGGRIDAALCRIKHSRSLESEFDFSIPYFFDCTQVLIIKGGIKSVADLKGRKIAAMQGSPAEKAAMKVLRDAGDDAAEKNVVSYPDRPSCFLALGREKVSGWVDSGTTLLDYASRSPGRYELLPVSERLEPIAVALPQDDSAWRDFINFTIQDMAADGSLKTLYDRWFGPDPPHPFPIRGTVEVWSE